MADRRFFCNPLSKKSHSRIVHRLTRISDKLRERFPEEIKEGQFICSACYGGLLKNEDKNKGTGETLPTLPVDSLNEVPNELRTSTESTGGREKATQQAIMEALNKTLGLLGQAPISRDWDDLSLAERQNKMDSIKKSLFKCLIPEGVDDDAAVDEIKEMLEHTDDPGEQAQFLTMVPTSWSAKKLQETFNASYLVARRACLLRESEDMKSSTCKRPRRSLKNTK